MQIIIYAFGRELFIRFDKRRPSPTVIVTEGNMIPVDGVMELIRSYWDPAK